VRFTSSRPPNKELGLPCGTTPCRSPAKVQWRNRYAHFPAPLPDGDVEYRSRLDGLAVGTRIRARGATWRVGALDGATVILESVETESPDGGTAGPLVLPDPLGDRPLTLEVLAEA
jgi:hypothetical protein